MPRVPRGSQPAGKLLATTTNLFAKSDEEAAIAFSEQFCQNIDSVENFISWSTVQTSWPFVQCPAGFRLHLKPVSSWLLGCSCV